MLFEVNIDFEVPPSNFLHLSLMQQGNELGPTDLSRPGWAK